MLRDTVNHRSHTAVSWPAARGAGRDALPPSPLLDADILRRLLAKGWDADKIARNSGKTVKEVRAAIRAAGIRSAPAAPPQTYPSIAPVEEAEEEPFEAAEAADDLPSPAERDPIPYDPGVRPTVRGRLRLQAPNGMFVELLDQEEVDVFRDTVDSYLRVYQWDDPSDLQILTNLALIQVQQYRVFSAASDRKDKSVDQDAVMKRMTEQAIQMAKLMESLGITRKQREAAAAGKKVSDRFAELMTRYREYKAEKGSRRA